MNYEMTNKDLLQAPSIYIRSPVLSISHNNTTPFLFLHTLYLH